MKTLVAGVGYSNLRDLSFGPILTPQLAKMDWPVDVEVDDLSFGPIAVVHRFQAQMHGRGDSESRPYKRVVLFSAVSRGRAPGAVTVYRWTGKLPPAEEIQARVGEAVTGVISLDNLLIIGEQFGIWPEEVNVIEVEPQDEGWGPGFSLAVEAAIGEVIEAVRRAVLSDRLPDLPVRTGEPAGMRP